MRNKLTYFLVAAFVSAICMAARADTWDVESDTYVATDALGRKLSGCAASGPPRPDRYVGIFYFLWLDQHGTSGPYDITEILAENPGDPQWGPVQAFHHWGESELGYYLSDDPYVIRKHCHMLADAGVDTLVFDVTNAFTYTSNYMRLCSILQQIRDQGGTTPQICFLANSAHDVVVTHLYNDFYSKSLYPDLWFRWLGKPLILSKPDGLSQEIKDFFTFRQSWAWSQSTWFGDGRDKWPWLDHYPQQPGWHVSGVPEELSVCVAQHPTSNIGRSFHAGTQPSPENFRTDEGLCFAEQWSRILEPPVDPEEESDPQFVFITGWNEWVAQRFLSDGSQWFLGRQLPAGETFFVDAYTQEYSRDIEPMTGGHTDNYYYQMIDYIRRFKGVRQPELASPAKTISIDADFSEWDDVGPEFKDTVGDTVHRNHPGWGSAGTYVDTTGRNDIVASKVARDDDCVYLYVQTKDPLTSYTSPNWMLLFIDSDCDSTTGWHGYDYLVNQSVTSPTTTTLKKSTGGWNWQFVDEVSYRASANKMEIKIPRSDIGLGTTPRILFDFHWADNIQKPDDIIEFAVSGDSAPNRRFNYRYVTSPPGPVGSFSASPGRSECTLSWHNPSDADFHGTAIRVSTTAYPSTPSSGDLVIKKRAAPGSDDSYSLYPLNPQTTYYFSAFAQDTAGHWSAAAHAEAVPLPDVTPPSGVTSLMAEPDTSENLSLSWTSPTDGDLACNRAASPGSSDSFLHTEGVHPK